jgi:hypothetical protein
MLLPGVTEPIADFLQKRCPYFRGTKRVIGSVQEPDRNISLTAQTPAIVAEISCPFLDAWIVRAKHVARSNPELIAIPPHRRCRDIRVLTLVHRPTPNGHPEKPAIDTSSAFRPTDRHRSAPRPDAELRNIR